MVVVPLLMRCEHFHEGPNDGGALLVVGVIDAFVHATALMAIVLQGARSIKVRHARDVLLHQLHVVPLNQFRKLWWQLIQTRNWLVNCIDSSLNTLN